METTLRPHKAGQKQAPEGLLSSRVPRVAHKGLLVYFLVVEA